MIVVSVPVRAESVLNKREHWAARARRAKRHRQAAHWALKGQPLPPLPVTVTLTRVAPRELDGDNAQASMKAVRDGVADWLHIDDASPHVRWNYAQAKGQPKQYAVLVMVEEA